MPKDQKDQTTNKLYFKLIDLLKIFISQELGQFSENFFDLLEVSNNQNFDIVPSLLYLKRSGIDVCFARG